MQMSLFDLQKTYYLFIELLERRGGEINESEEHELALLESTLLAKADSCAFVLDKLESEADFYKQQAERLLGFSRVCSNARQRLKDRITEAVKMSPDKTIEGETISFTLKKNPPSLIVNDESLVPDKFVETVVTRKVDKSAIKAALKQGEEVQGVELVQDESLKISRPKK
jgi:hypothetical protein